MDSAVSEMSFGYGAGDEIASGTLIYQLIKTISGTQYSSEEYQDALAELGAFQRIFVQISQMAETPNTNPAAINAASQIVLSSMNLIGDFVARTKSYQKRVNSWQNMGWVLFKADELKALKEGAACKNDCEVIPRKGARAALKEIKSSPHSSPSSAGIRPNTPKLIEGTVGVASISSPYRSVILKNNDSMYGAPLPQLEDLRNVKRVQEFVSQATPSVGADENSRPPPLGRLSQGTATQTFPDITEDFVDSLVKEVIKTRVVDITPQKVLDKDFCRKSLTSYEAHSIRKIQPRDPNQKSIWAKSEIFKEPLSQQEISRAVMRLNGSKRSVQDKKAALMLFQQGQVNRLLEELTKTDLNANYEWLLAQLDRREFTNKEGLRETSTITVYVKRTPLVQVDAIHLYNAIEISKQQRLERVSRQTPETFR